MIPLSDAQIPGPTWTTKSGKKIPIKDMSDDHIRNALKFVDKRIQEVMDPTSLGMRPREAARYKWPSIMDLEQEACRRSL